uniref:Uncharacterized protein n=1 Tax=Rhizophora mucronata TaxID=61149 RepID=A0A2P2NNA0_RHIMU
MQCKILGFAVPVFEVLKVNLSHSLVP